MNLFELREKEIFETLKKIKECGFVLIGGYAVNVYTLPRFSVDCDIVVADTVELEKIMKVLEEEGYKKEDASQINTPYHGEFIRYEKILENNFRVSMDILVKEILDRQTNATFDAAWVFDNSTLKTLKGKTIADEIKLRIITVDALIVMKWVSCRSTGIRDIFMLITKAKDIDWIKKEIAERTDFRNRCEKITEKITDQSFKNNLQGVYGFIDEALFEKHKKMILKLCSN